MPITIDHSFVYPSILVDPTPMPALVFLHGQKERGDNLSLVENHGPPHYATSGVLPSLELMRVIAPQCPLEQTWSDPANARDVAKLITTLRQANYVDSTKIYLTGWSMGGYGVCSVLLSLGDDLPVAAAAVVSGGSLELKQSETARLLARTPFFVAYGKNDKRVPPAESVRLLDALGKHSNDLRREVYSDPMVLIKGEPSPHVLACRHAFSQAPLYMWLLQHRRERIIP